LELFLQPSEKLQNTDVQIGQHFIQSYSRECLWTNLQQQHSSTGTRSNQQEMQQSKVKSAAIVMYQELPQKRLGTHWSPGLNFYASASRKRAENSFCIMVTNQGSCTGSHHHPLHAKGIIISFRGCDDVVLMAD
jgi:hypothetical protein